MTTLSCNISAMRASERPLESFKELGYRGHSWSLELHWIQPYSGTTSDQGRHGFPSLKDPIKSQIRNLPSRFLFSLSSGPPLQSLISLFQWISSFKSLSIQGQLLAIKFGPRQPHLIRHQAASLSRKKSVNSNPCRSVLGADAAAAAARQLSSEVSEVYLPTYLDRMPPHITLRNCNCYCVVGPSQCGHYVPVSCCWGVPTVNCTQDTSKTTQILWRV